MAASSGGTEQRVLLHLGVELAEGGDRSPPVGRLQLDADPAAAEPDCGVDRRPDPVEHVQYGLAGVGPEPYAPLDEIQLKRANVTLVGVLAGHSLVECVRLPDRRPHRREPVTAESAKLGQAAVALVVPDR